MQLFSSMYRTHCTRAIFLAVIKLLETYQCSRLHSCISFLLNVTGQTIICPLLLKLWFTFLFFLKLKRNYSSKTFKWVYFFYNVSNFTSTFFFHLVLESINKNKLVLTKYLKNTCWYDNYCSIIKDNFFQVNVFNVILWQTEQTFSNIQYLIFVTFYNWLLFLK